MACCSSTRIFIISLLFRYSHSFISTKGRIPSHFVSLIVFTPFAHNNAPLQAIPRLHDAFQA